MYSKKNETTLKNDETKFKGGSILYLSKKKIGAKERDRKLGERFLHHVLRRRRKQRAEEEEEAEKRVKGREGRQ